MFGEGGQVRPLKFSGGGKTQERGRFSILTRIRKRTQDALLRAELLCGDANFRTLVEAMAGAIFVSQGKWLHYVNHAAETITGYARKELLSMNFWDLVHPGSRELVREGPQHEVKILAKSGEERWLDVRTATIEFDGVPSSLVCAFDLTERKKAEEQLQLLAVTDPLTGLGNYRRLVEALDAEIKRSERTGRPFAILLLDLDGLKKINNGYGHWVGSQSLCRLAGVLRVFCRAIDTAARYGGDEFAIILPETKDAAAWLVASRIQRRLAADILQPALSVSIGVAIYPHGGKTVETLLRTADRELYGMKSRESEEPNSSVCSLVSPLGRTRLEKCFSETERTNKQIARG